MARILAERQRRNLTTRPKTSWRGTRRRSYAEITLDFTLTKKWHQLNFSRSYQTECEVIRVCYFRSACFTDWLILLARKPETSDCLTLIETLDDFVHVIADKYCPTVIVCSPIGKCCMFGQHEYEYSYLHRKCAIHRTSGKHLPI